MSATGDSSWADAGLVPPAEVDGRDAGRSAVPVPWQGDDPEEHRPGPARPDLRDDADEPDVVEQALDGDGDPEDYPDA